MGAGYGMAYGMQYEPRVQPGYYGVPGADAGNYVADAFLKQQQYKHQQLQNQQEETMGPLEVALYKAKLREMGVSGPGMGDDSEPTPGAGGNGGVGAATPGAPPAAKRIPLQLPAPYAGDPTMGGNDVAPTVSMPGAFNPATNAHNTVLPPSQGASTPAASGVGAGPSGVSLGGGFRYTDPALANVERYKAMGFPDADAQVMARNPQIAAERIRERNDDQYKETPDQKFARDRALEQAKQKDRGDTDIRVATARGEIAPRGQMTRKQVQDWVDQNYSGYGVGPDGATMPALTPSQRLVTAERIYQSQLNQGRPGAGGAPASRSLFKAHTNVSTPAAGAPATATPPGTQQPTVTPTAPAGAQPSAPGAAPAPAAGGGGGQVVQGDQAIQAAADSLSNHPNIDDATATQVLRKHGFDDGHIRQVLQLRRRGR